jgi:hypothetical protein
VVELDILKRVAILLLAEPTLALKVALVQRLGEVLTPVPVLVVAIPVLGVGVGVEVVLTPVQPLKPLLKV